MQNNKTMRSLIVIFLLVNFNSASSQKIDSISRIIIDMEKSALERWNNGDPSGFLEISAKDVVYFDPFSEHRLDGLDELTKLYESIRGQIHVDKYNMTNPNVQAVDDMAVLTYNLISYSGDNSQKWNCTEVYRLDKNKWEIIEDPRSKLRGIFDPNLVFSYFNAR
jgi:ketosteroid isomerase-like protein